MGKKNKYKHGSLSGIIRYTDKRMNGEERNALEKELQKDHFSNEALEGLSTITSQEALKDVSNLQNQLKKRVVDRQQYIFYRIAASVAVLITISSIFIIVEINKPKQLASDISRAEPAEIAESRPISPPAGRMEPSEQPVRSLEKKSVRARDKNNKSEAKEVLIRTENHPTAGYQHKDSISEVEVRPQEENLKPEQIAAVSQASAGAQKSELSKEAVSDYDAMKAVSKKKDIPSGYLPPQPVGGRSDFNKYIRENLQMPDTVYSGKNAIVVLVFSVHTDGSIDSIKIIRSPGRIFADEAIRLLRSGPSWQPAKDNGQIIEDQVRLSIVFK
jgi:hypothetical protein